MTLTDLDYQIFHFINEQAGLHPMWNSIMRFLAEDAQYLLALGLVLYWFTRRPNYRRAVVQSVIAVCIGLGISFVIGHLVSRDRPFVAHEVIQLISHAANASFPSDHANFTFALAVTFALNRLKFRSLWLLLAALISISRVYTGVHYPSDILAGALLGTGCAVIVHSLLAHNRTANRAVEGAIALYERIERKIWRGSAASQNSK
ncbi:undecaprenyl-diphosphatase [Paenibacillus sp. CAA11]|uniref:undecaprenyl-diphosphatase n=1 Tax=Paenibacillus sp. CAA11 TaxID=1532905 RepID=UPI000D3A40E8|nr:undecaprenyl-diphosphatase [Paenibacillus sp. CAA11]AWB44625.1 undecaprenyl-diphosphatase [Paenibacillus sp. CAA11]